MVDITEKNLNEILYHLDCFMRLMGFGGEYNKIVKLVKELPLKEMDLSEFYHINNVINPPKTYDIDFEKYWKSNGSLKLEDCIKKK